MADTPLLPVSRNCSQEWNYGGEHGKCAFQRSAKMSLLQLYVPIELANVTVAELGILEIVEFIDMNPGQNLLKRTFARELKKCQEMGRIIRYLEGELQRSLPQVEELLPRTSSLYRFFNSTREFEELEQNLHQREDKLRTITNGIGQLESKVAKLAMQRAILRELIDIMHSALLEQTDPLYVQLDSGENLMQLIAGSISVEKYFLLERIIWKLMRGNLLLKSNEMADFPDRTFFVIYVHGPSIRERVRTTCISLGAVMVESGWTYDSIEEKFTEISAHLLRISQILDNSREMQLTELHSIRGHIRVWKGCVQREERIYTALNMLRLEPGNRYLIGNVWCASKDTSLVMASLERIAFQTNANLGPFATEIAIDPDVVPPTYITTNRFTSGFQDLMDAYGIPAYKELNPAAFSIITFPFLFAVMFGDLGHGFMILAFAIWMSAKEKIIAKSTAPIFNNEIFQMAFHGRYILLLMGVFSIFTGLIYNDVFSRPLHLFKSGWSLSWETPKQHGVYPFGIDWAWLQSSNSLSFVNSYKMKQSILFGLLHMYFGIFLSAWNNWYFGRKCDILYDSVPQTLFLSSIFGYLGFLILYKWAIPSENHPSLLTTIIDMVLNPLHLSRRDQLFNGQKHIQLMLLTIAAICVFWMLLAKPLATIYASRSRLSYTPLAIGSQEDLNAHRLREEEKAPSELFLNQSIHTIEFVLGSISNTASYLRLWALSLAHAQLSEVLWQMLIAHARSFGWPIRTVLYSLWFFLTVFIMVVLEGLSAFLHSLRLHWVEFNGKFFHGDGRKFAPFSFKSPSQ